MKRKSHTDPMLRRIRHGFFQRLARGTVLLLPLLITFWLVQFAFETLDGLLQPLIAAIAGEEVTGLSFAIIVASLLIVGAFSSNLVFNSFGYLAERGIISIPGVGSIYSTTKKLLAHSDSEGETATGFETVVRVEYPHLDVWSVGFLMGVVTDSGGTRFGVIYMPSTPLPQSGWLAQVPLEKIHVMDWSPAEAMQYIVSAGVSCPQSVETRPLNAVSKR